MVARALCFALFASLAAAGPGCVSGGGFPDVRLAADDRVVDLALNETECASDAPRRWFDVTGAELASPDTLLVRVVHAACATPRFSACASGVVIYTDPGLWEVTLDARAPEGTPCQGSGAAEATASSVLRIDLSSSRLAARGALDRVRAVHEFPTSSAERRTLADRRRDPRPVKIDLLLRPD
jgi:hypothetical protein